MRGIKEQHLARLVKLANTRQTEVQTTVQHVAYIRYQRLAQLHAPASLDRILLTIEVNVFRVHQG